MFLLAYFEAQFPSNERENAPPPIFPVRERTVSSLTSPGTLVYVLKKKIPAYVSAPERAEFHQTGSIIPGQSRLR